MTDAASNKQAAIALMLQALSLLAASGDDRALELLNGALEAAQEGVVDDPTAAGGDVHPCLAANAPLIRAMGGALGFVAMLMQRRDQPSVEEFSRLLGLYAVATDATSREEGLILGCWAGLLGDFAEAAGSAAPGMKS